MVPTDISVIIPTLNAAETIKKILPALADQDQPAGEVIIIDSGSKDHTPGLAESLKARVLRIEPDTFDHGKTRNLGARKSRGNILIFMTQDALPVDGSLITNLVKPLLEDPTVALAYARQLAAPGATLSEQYLRLANYPPDSITKSQEDLPRLGINTYQCSNVCAAYRRSTFETLGGFPYPVVCNEDMLFSARAIRAGYKVIYSAEAKVQHTHHLRCKELFKRYFDISASLDHEPTIRTLGRAEARGLAFFKNQLFFLRKQQKPQQVPRVILETTARYLGYKAGANHARIPQNFKKHLGSNTLYWCKTEREPGNRA